MSETNHELKLHALDYWQVIRNRYGVILLAFFLVFMTATVITYMMPKEYLGRVSVQINKESKTKIEKEVRDPEPYLTFMQTEFAIIESKENFDRVSKELDLKSLWNLPSDQDTYSRLVRKVNVRDRRGTKLVDIEAYDPDPQLAAKLANSVAESYKLRREELDRDRMNKKIEELELQAKKQEGLMAKAQQEMIRLQELGGFVEIGGNRWGDRDFIDTKQDVIVQSSQMTLHEMEREISRLRTTITSTPTGTRTASVITMAMAKTSSR